MKMQNRTAVYLSIQEIISCSTPNKNGCSFGYFDTVFAYVQKYGVGQSISYYYDDKAKKQGIVSDCNIAVIATKAYAKNRIFIKEYKKVKYADCN